MIYYDLLLKMRVSPCCTNTHRDFLQDKWEILTPRLEIATSLAMLSIVEIPIYINLLISNYTLVGGLVAFSSFPIYWVANHPN